MAYNNLTSSSLTPGTILKLPPKTTADTTITKNEKNHIVSAGDTLYSIAKKYNTTVDTLKKINNLSSNILSLNQVIYLPTDESSTTTTIDTYTVTSGDTLYKIAQQYNTTVSELKSLNNLTSNILSIGQTLKVPTSSTAYFTYTVTSGDTLYSIAKAYNTTVSEIKNLNNLSSNLISLNQTLKLPK